MTETESTPDDGPLKLALTDEEVAMAVGISRRTVWRLVSAGTLPAPRKIQGTRLVRWPLPVIEEWLAGLPPSDPNGKGQGGQG